MFKTLKHDPDSDWSSYDDVEDLRAHIKHKKPVKKSPRPMREAVLLADTNIEKGKIDVAFDVLGQARLALIKEYRKALHGILSTTYKAILRILNNKKYRKLVIAKTSYKSEQLSSFEPIASILIEKVGGKGKNANKWRRALIELNAQEVPAKDAQAQLEKVGIAKLCKAAADRTKSKVLKAPAQVRITLIVDRRKLDKRIATDGSATVIVTAADETDVYVAEKICSS